MSKTASTFLSLGRVIGLLTVSVIASSLESELSSAGELDLGHLRWHQTESCLTLAAEDQVIWQFNFGKELHKPYFHPVKVGEHELTVDRPKDHIWHHGVWFSWKYINRVNYWEINGKTGKPDGTTSWLQPQIEIKDDYSATFRMHLMYAAASDGIVILNEQRTIRVAPPDKNGELTIDWLSVFTAAEDALLDRTPAGKQPWGGYAGLSVRLSQEFTERSAVNTSGAIAFDDSNRNRSVSDAVDFHGVIGAQSYGVAFFDHPKNVKHPTKWYVIRTPVMSYMNAALIHDEPLGLKQGDQLRLQYRLVAHPGRWDAEQLKAKQQQFDTDVPLDLAD